MRDDALLLGQVWPGRERKLELVRGEHSREILLAASATWLALVAICGGVVGIGGWMSAL